MPEDSCCDCDISARLSEEGGCGAERCVHVSLGFHIRDAATATSCSSSDSSTPSSSTCSCSSSGPSWRRRNRRWTSASFFPPPPCLRSRVFAVSLCLLVATTDVSASIFQFTVEPSDLVVTRGAAARLDCRVSPGVPNVSVTWKRDGQTLTFGSNSRKRLMENGSLYFGEIQRSRLDSPDEGMYQCMAEAEQIGKIVSQTAKLQVATLPPLVSEPRDQQVTQGDVVRFECASNSIPKGSVEWFKDDRQMQLDPARMTVLSSGVLEIDDVRLADVGLYHCVLSSAGKVRKSRSGNLRVSTPSQRLTAIRPSFLAYPKDRVAEENEEVLLECAANGFPKPVIVWLKDGHTVDLANRYKYQRIGSGNLRIRAVTMEDEGTYQCRAENNIDSQDASARLQVLVPPKFVRRPQDVAVKPRADAELVCDVTGYPLPTVKWTRNGEDLYQNDYFQVVNGNLKILGVVKEDAGMYQCFASNPAGNIQSAALMVVSENPVLPELNSNGLSLFRSEGEESKGTSAVPPRPEDLKEVLVDKRFVTLSWRLPVSETPESATGIGGYSVMYHEEGSSRERIVNTTSAEAMISDLTPNTRYTFRVVSLGKMVEGQQFQPQSQPSVPLTVLTQLDETAEADAPQQLKAEALSENSIEVRWLPPSSGVKEYVLHYIDSKTSEQRQVSTRDTTEILRNLKPFTEYVLWVVSVAEDGSAGLATDDLRVRTLSTAPSAPPENLTLEATGATSLMVRWEPPPEEHQNGLITGYKIRFKSRDESRSKTVTTDANRRGYTLTSLKKNHEYSVRVAALTMNGTGPWTDWIRKATFETDLTETRVPGPPASIRVRAETTSITIQWTPPRDNSILVREYTIGYGEGFPDKYQNMADGKQRHYQLSNLKPGTEYVISLRASNLMGEGQPVYEHVRTRSENEVPSKHLTTLVPPVGVRAVVHSENTIILSWTDSTLPRNQRVVDNRYYQIQYSTGGGRPRFRNTTALQYMFDQLKPATRYEFSVKVIKGNRESSWSLMVENTTEEATPSSAPRDLTILPSEEDPTVLNINWQPPKLSNGVVTGYMISYTTDQRQLDQSWVYERVVGDRLTKTLKGFQPDVTYYFRVHALNRKGQSPPSPTVVHRTGPEYAATVPLMYIILACVGVFILSLLLISTIYLLIQNSRRKSRAAQQGAGRKKYLKAQQIPEGARSSELKPPDLWIHHEQIELRSGKQTPDLAVTATTEDTLLMSQSTLERRRYQGGAISVVPSSASSHPSSARSTMYGQRSTLNISRDSTSIPGTQATSMTDQSYESLPHVPHPGATIASVHPIPMSSLAHQWRTQPQSYLPPPQSSAYTIVSQMGLNQLNHQQQQQPYHSPSVASSSVSGDSDQNPPSGTAEGFHPNLKSFSRVLPNNSSLGFPVASSSPTSLLTSSYKASPAPNISSPQLLQSMAASTSPDEGFVGSSSSPFKVPSSRIGLVAPQLSSPYDPSTTTGVDQERESLLKPSSLQHELSASTEELNAEMANLDGLMKDLNSIGGTTRGPNSPNSPEHYKTGGKTPSVVHQYQF